MHWYQRYVCVMVGFLTSGMWASDSPKTPRSDSKIVAVYFGFQPVCESLDRNTPSPTKTKSSTKPMSFDFSNPRSVHDALKKMDLINRNDMP